MLTYEDCLGLCGLTEEEVAAIAAHEHIPEICAAELGNYLLHEPGGVVRIKRMIVEDIVAAKAKGELDRIACLKTALRHFIQTHKAESGSVDFKRRLS